MDNSKEKKDENSSNDVNKDEKANSINDELDKEKIQGNQFDSEGTLDIDLEEKSKDSSVSEKQSKTIRTIVFLVLLILPIVYFLYKTKGTQPAPIEQAADQTKKIDIAAYESVANATPSFSNLLNLSNAYINSGMPGKAIEPLKKAIVLDPNSAAAFSNLGLAYTCIQNYQKGIEFGEKAVQLDSTFQLAKNNLNWARTEQNKLLEAITLLDKTPEKDRNSFYYITLGLNYLKLQEFDKSIEIFNNILVTDPKNSEALINIGVAYMSKLQYNDAIKHFQKAIDVNSNNQLAKNNLAWALGEKIKADSLVQLIKDVIPTKK